MTRTHTTTTDLPDLHELPDDDLPDLPELSSLVSSLQGTTIARGRRLIAIIRVSKTGGREDKGEAFQSPEVQIGKVDAYAAAHGSEIVDYRREMNVSGGKVDREVLNGAVADVLAGKADGIIVAYVSRYARTTAGLQMVRTLQAEGKTFVAVDEQIGPEMLATSFGWFTFTIMLAVAELQLAMLTEGFLLARRTHIGLGIANKVPYGYRKRTGGDPDAADLRERPRRLEPDPETAEWVPFIFGRRAAGDSWITIATALDKRGAPTPGKTACWHYERVRAIVQNRTYLGELRSGELVNETAHFPLVAPELFAAANALNQTPKRNGKADYALTGIVRCATCGGRMVGFMQTVKGGRKRDGEAKRYPYYRCRRTYSWGRCPAPAYAPAGELEQLVTDEFFRRFTRDLLAKGEAQDRRGELDAAEAVVVAAEAATDRFLSSPATERLTRMRGQVWFDGELERLADELEAAVAARQEVVNSLTGMELPEGLEERWDDLPCEERRGFLSEAFGVVAVRQSGGRRVPVIERIAIWARNEPGSPEAKLAARSEEGRIIKVPIEF